MNLTRLNSCARLFIPTVTMASVLLACAVCEAASPPNDDLANAQVIPTDSFSVAGTEVGASQESFERSPNFADTYGFDLSASVWYAWTPSESGQLDVSAVNNGSNGDGTAVFLFLGPSTPTSSTVVAGVAPGQSRFSTAVIANQPYFFFVANEAVAAHPFTLAGTFTAESAPAPVVTLSVKTPQVSRSGGAPGKMHVELSSAATADLTIAYKTGGTAVNGTDYKMLSGNVTVPKGATKAAVKIQPLPGSTDPLSVKLTVTAGNGYTVGSPAKGKIEIVN